MAFVAPAHVISGTTSATVRSTCPLAVSSRPCSRATASRAARSPVLARSVQRDQEQSEQTQRPLNAALAALAAAQLMFAPFSGPALAALDTSTMPAPLGGAGAKIEGSNLANQSGADALQQLTDVAIPAAESALAKLDTSAAKSAAGELNGLTQQVTNLNERLNSGKGLKDSELKSAVSGIEQQLNAAKATAGLD
ncbi:hypothetical protein WJX73_000863 [Symbiochloris irregularis]|uniref:Plastid lipid-associated protein/fibrillin conserved domain-containing protein n=1 Tax=Symbiochloris irregularis TaxID=706552 RepID=A0AAW1P2B6_9CHLO